MTVTFFSLFFTGPELHGQQLLRRIKSDLKGLARTAAVRKKPPIDAKDDQMERLAKELDWLEAYLNKYGSVVAKQPDIWGESRLTRFRSEYEREMAGQLGEFQARDNASISREDIAALASATGLSAGLGTPNVNASVVNGVPTVSPPEEEGNAVTQNVLVATPGAALAGTSLTARSNLDITEELDQRSRYLNHLQQLRRINSGDDTSDAPGYALNLIRIPISISPGQETRRGHGAKVTITAKPITSKTLLPETFENLVISDMVDQLALPILKLSESNSLDYWRRSLDFDILYRPTIFRMFKINDRIIEGKGTQISTQISLEDAMEFVFEQGSLRENLNVATRMTNQAIENLNVHRNEPGMTASGRSSITTLISNIRMRMEQVVEIASSPREMRTKENENTCLRNIAQNNRDLLRSLRDEFKDTIGTNSVSRRRRSSLPIAPTELFDSIGHRSLIAIASDFEQSYSGRMVAWNQRENAPRIHLPDVRHYLQANFESAYKMLMTPQNSQIVTNTIESRLADWMTETRWKKVTELRYDFMTQLDPSSAVDQIGELEITPLMSSFAWSVVVEMALLNDQLNKDVHDIAVTRGDCNCQPSQKHKYYLPMPENHHLGHADSEFYAAAKSFEDYVQCRWPIHVFHVDPVNETQNVQDSSSVSRQLAIAAAIGVANGELNFRQANQFTRNYREQINTIGLNRTISAFSHSNDTFGWTFRPRVQTRAGQGNLAAFGETLFGRGADANIREALIEPGMRECSAIVLMPSFVPYCDFEIATSWHRLDNPRSKDLSNHQTLKLSRSIRYMKQCSLDCASCTHLYRDGESERLLNRVKQLERELPLQTLRAQIPYENTLGGFELFSNGVTDLAPELVGWYGAPGIEIGESATPATSTPPAMTSAATATTAGATMMASSGSSTTNPMMSTTPSPAAMAMTPAMGSSSSNTMAIASSSAAAMPSQGTDVFLVGDNFSVHDTRIIAGGVDVTDSREMISRQTIRIRVPRNARTVMLNDGDGTHEYVAVYASTPYGVTSHLHIPVFRAQTTTAQTVTNRVAALETRLNVYSWDTLTPLPIVASLSQRPDGKVERTGSGLGSLNEGTAYVLRWPGVKLPDGQTIPSQAGLMGAFVVNNQRVGDAFWIRDPWQNPIILAPVPPTDLPIGSHSITAKQLADVLQAPIKDQLTTDKTQNEGNATVSLSTWIVPRTTVSNSGMVSHSNGQPVATNGTITIQLTRRIDPMPRPQGSNSNAAMQTPLIPGVMVPAPGTIPNAPVPPASPVPSSGNGIQPIPSGSGSRNDFSKPKMQTRQAGLDSSRRSFRLLLEATFFAAERRHFVVLLVSMGKQIRYTTTSNK